MSRKRKNFRLFLAVYASSPIFATIRRKQNPTEMKNFTFSAFLLILFAAFCPMHLLADEPVVITVDASTGTCNHKTNGVVSGAGKYFYTWTSTATDPQVKISTAANDMWIHTDGTSVHYFGGKTFTFAVTGDYTISGYDIVFEGYNGNSNATSTSRIAMTINAATGESASCTSSAEGSLSVSGLAVATTSFTVAAPSSGNGNIMPKSFTVTLTKREYASEEPASPTSIVGGDFDEYTRWQKLVVRNSSFQVYYASDSQMLKRVRTPLTETDADLWCIIGDRTNGYRIYNKAAGPAKCLATPLSGLTRGVAPVFMNEESLDETAYSKLWYFVPSAQSIGDEEGSPVYLVSAGNTEYALNEYQELGQMKFWEGRDQGSTFIFQPTIRNVTPVDQTHGSLIREDGTSGSWYNCWSSTATNPSVTVRNTKNNMQFTSDGTTLVMSKNNSSDYTVSVPDGYVITAYSFTFTNPSGEFTVTPSEGGAAATCEAGSFATVSVSGIARQITSFSLSSSSQSTINVTDFTVTVDKYVAPDLARTVKVFDNANSSVPYRIPALARTASGRLILVVDYRYSHADIGNGPIDLRYKYSDDNGFTWSEERTNLGDGDASKSEGNQWDYAFGDPSIVADAENPNEVLVMAVGGHVGYFSATYDNPQYVVRFRSHDGGLTWDKGTNITYDIYDLYNNGAVGKAKGIFLTSGRIMQSRYIKVGDYYRLYIAHPFRGDNDQACFVIYSDDFGETWQVLGGAQTIASNGKDESKAEELPDGSVMISSRVQSGGRTMNVFAYTDAAKGEGVWSSSTVPVPMQYGKVNACNGETLVLPARRTSDGADVYVILQSVPQSSSRQFVGFFYKEVASAHDYATGPQLASGWKTGLRVTQLDACYSTMQMMDNDSIAFVYEESGYNGGYDIIFKAFSLDSITAGEYSYNPGFTAREAYFESSLNERISEVSTGAVVGQPISLEPLEVARTAFEENPTQQNMESVLNTYLYGLETVPVEADKSYILQAYIRYDKNTRYLIATQSILSIVANTTDNPNEKFSFIPTGEDGLWYLYCDNLGVYACDTKARETSVLVTSNLEDAAKFRVVSQVNGHSALVCQNPEVASWPALHYAESEKVVPWTVSADGSQWLITPVVPTGITCVEAASERNGNIIYDLQGRRVANPEKGVYIYDGRKIVLKK